MIDFEGKTIFVRTNEEAYKLFYMAIENGYKPCLGKKMMVAYNLYEFSNNEVRHCKEINLNTLVPFRDLLRMEDPNIILEDMVQYCRKNNCTHIELEVDDYEDKTYGFGKIVNREGTPIHPSITVEKPSWRMLEFEDVYKSWVSNFSKNKKD